MAIAEWKQAPTPPKSGCERFAPAMRVVSVLKAPKGGRAQLLPPGPEPVSQDVPKAGQTITVVVNGVAMQDCKLRRELSSGASFPAERVSMSLTRAAMEKGTRFVVFLEPVGGDVWQLTAGGAMLSLGHEAAVRNRLAPPPPAAPPVGRAYPVPDHWAQRTVGEFCEAQLKGSVVTGGVGCPTGEPVPLQASYATYKLLACSQSVDSTAVRWRALFCAKLEP